MPYVCGRCCDNPCTCHLGEGQVAPTEEERRLATKIALGIMTAVVVIIALVLVSVFYF